MRRFAKLTRDGQSVYVDPCLVGVVVAMPGYSPATPTGKTAIWSKGDPTTIVVDRIEESPDEVYRRLCAAAMVVTKSEYEEIQGALSEAVVFAGAALRDARLARVANEKEMIALLIKPIQAAYDKLKATTLAALWVAEGEEPPK